ncbi:MAG: hypothetical protein P4L33_19655 [Capsulimonadaceae bacterium]|nr:hypothetical protein [Capsulimonadaceae bacterium]
MELTISEDYQPQETFRPLTLEERAEIERSLVPDKPYVPPPLWTYLISPLGWPLTLVGSLWAAYYFGFRDCRGWHIYVALLSIIPMAIAALQTVIVAGDLFRELRYRLQSASRERRPAADVAKSVEESRIQWAREILDDGYAVIRTFTVYDKDVQTISVNEDIDPSYLVALDKTHTLFVNARLVADKNVTWTYDYDDEDDDDEREKWPSTLFEIVTTRKNGYFLEFNCLGEPIESGDSHDVIDDDVFNEDYAVLSGSIDSCVDILTLPILNEKKKTSWW